MVVDERHVGFDPLKAENGTACDYAIGEVERRENVFVQDSCVGIFQEPGLDYCEDSLGQDPQSSFLANGKITQARKLATR